MKLSKAQRATLREMFGGHCAYCGCALGDRWHADHFEHVERKMKWTEVDGRRRLVCAGGVHRPERDTIENMMPSCAPCNIDKHCMTLEDWRTKLQNAVAVLMRNQPTFRHALRFGLVHATNTEVVFHFERLAAEIGRAEDGGEKK